MLVSYLFPHTLLWMVNIGIRKRTPHTISQKCQKYSTISVWAIIMVNYYYVFMSHRVAINNTNVLILFNFLFTNISFRNVYKHSLFHPHPSSFNLNNIFSRHFCEKIFTWVSLKKFDKNDNFWNCYNKIIVQIARIYISKLDCQQANARFSYICTLCVYIL